MHFKDLSDCGVRIECRRIKGESREISQKAVPKTPDEKLWYSDQDG